MNDIDNFDLIKHLEEGTLIQSQDWKQEKNIAAIAADNFLSKDRRINIRLSTSDLTLLKRKAAEEGLPYQSLVTSILHKYAMGKLRNVSNH